MGTVIFFVVVGLLFAAFFYAQHRAGFRWWRPPPPAPDHTFQPGRYRTLNSASQIGWLVASWPFTGLKIDDSWARIRSLRTKWIARDETATVERVRVLGVRATLFRSADGRYDDVILYDGWGSVQLLGEFGWPTSD